MSDMPEKTDVFQFMELRAPFSPEVKSLRQNYIRDDFVGLRDDKAGRFDVDLQSAESPSAIGRLVYEQVFCAPDLGNPAENLNSLITAVLELLERCEPHCAPAQPMLPTTHLPSTTTTATYSAPPLSIIELERRATVYKSGFYYLLPERLEQIENLTLFPEIERALEAMRRARAKFDLPTLIKQLEAIFKRTPLREVVFEQGIYAENFQSAKRTLFDTLYLLYILRRRTAVNLEYVIDGLRALHLLEALAIDSLIEAVETDSLFKADESLRETLKAILPELQDRTDSDKLSGLPLIQSKADFEAYLAATPIIHPIFARLHRYRFPFNDLKSIGIGDLKVVKQWLTAYLPGEISHIENILKGENKDRTHRRLEKTEESFSFSSSSKESSQQDTQSTDRFELKRETENVVKTELNVGANANLTYNYGGGMIIANVGANFSYKRDSNDQSKTADTFARETVSKAIQQIEKNAAETRSMTKLFETEETNKHIFDNSKDPDGHVTGIYRWLDKKYKAQLFNFGKRMMFEFIIPEPAAFFVEARLRAFQTTLEFPQKPQPPALKTVSLSFTPAQINETKFEELRQKYDLADFTFPSRTRRVAFINPATGEDYFKEQNVSGAGVWYAKTHSCRVNAKGYSLSNVTVNGFIEYQGRNETDARERNTLEIYIDGSQVVREQNEAILWWQKNPASVYPPLNPVVFAGDDVALTIGFWDVGHYFLSFYAELTISPQTLLDWQTQVFNKVKAVEQQKVDRENQELQIAYDGQMSTYRNRLAELKATSVNDLLQGQSEAFNREIINTELKKHCLTLLTKEFDADDWDDLIAKMGTIRGRSEPNNFQYRRFTVTENSTAASGSFEEVSETIDYPSIVLGQAKIKGRFIQFLEQAFEWQQLAYLFYPYFWASQPSWIEMMNRADDADPNLTAFLQAGSVKVLLAVTPAYEEAVLHFLATREPWEGGPAPVIGDPLFIPLHEELRKRQDDLYNAKPEGKPWTFTLPTSLVYLDDSGATLPTFPDVP